jgi:hypothetical protein
MTLRKIRNLFRRNLEKQIVDALPDFHPLTVLRSLGDDDFFRIFEALTGICVFGATGSGKTSGPAKFFAYAFLAAGFGGLILTAKKDERIQWEKWAADCGRTEDLVIIDAAGTYRFNFLQWETERSGDGGGFTTNIVNLLVVIASALAGGGPDDGGSNGSEKFWFDALRHLCTNLVDLAVLAGVEVTLPLLRSILNSAPLSAAQVNDPKWAEGDCASALRGADAATATGDDPEARADYEETKTYWTKEFPNLSEKTRSIIVLMLSMLVRPLVTRPLRKLFSSDTNITPEATFEGKIILVDLPSQEFHLIGKIANHIFKYCFQVAVLRRMQPGNGSFLRPAFLWSDEAQVYVTSYDAEYQSVARSAGGCTVYLTQNRENLRRVLKNDDAVDALLNNLQLKVFCQNTGGTNKYASEIMGERWQKISSTNVGQSRNEAIVQTEQHTHHNAGVSRSEQRRFYVEPALFSTLKKGGALNDFQVQAILFNGGQLFFNGKEHLPYKFITFDQR